MSNLTGQVFVVTGSATGVGAACVRQLSRDGARVVINYSRSETAARTTEAECCALGAETLLIKADVADDAACRDMVDRTLAIWGRIDGLVNNAAITKAADPFDLEQLSVDDFMRVYGINVVGAYQMTRAVAPAMKRQGRGAIVNVSSNVVFTGGGSSLAYTASKGALNALTLALARVLGPEIRVNAVCPGIVDTRWMRDGVGDAQFAALKQRFHDNAPMGRIADAEDVADAIVWLLCGTTYCTGELLGLDGGIRLSGGARKKRHQEAG
jgi:NAD(P)-dependent dehydrogenase (short-subunit alcohol dehydrogenase family)